MYSHLLREIVAFSMCILHRRKCQRVRLMKVLVTVHRIHTRTHQVIIQNNIIYSIILFLWKMVATKAPDSSLSLCLFCSHLHIHNCSTINFPQCDLIYVTQNINGVLENRIFYATQLEIHGAIDIDYVCLMFIYLFLNMGVGRAHIDVVQCMELELNWTVLRYAVLCCGIISAHRTRNVIS